MSAHAVMVATKGEDGTNKDWRCEDCGASSASVSDLMKTPCLAPRTLTDDELVEAIMGPSRAIRARGGVRMKERPIIFSGAMVRAILDGTKTQTRRLVFDILARCPHGVPGDRLWVRETHHQCPHCCRVTYRAGGWWRLPSEAPGDTGEINDVDARHLSPKCAAQGWRPSIYMPRWASRITLEVTDVRVERLQGITEEDARAEGVTMGAFPSCADAFSALWDEINGKRAPWSVNPWVWVVAFRRAAA